MTSTVEVETAPFMESGDHLSATEFLRVYEQMPDVKKAELIQGIVYMASPVRAEQHGKPDGIIQTWLGIYAATHDLEHYINTTVRFGRDDVFQPDGILTRHPERGSKADFDQKGYLTGAVDLVVEIAASTASLDAREKRVVYRRAGVQEYVLWRVQDQVIDWWSLENEEYVAISPDEHGLLTSRHFPGLRLDLQAALAFDRRKVLAASGGKF
ncbi:MAG: Uma2 family endonuclease [Verrucomicrobiales bacterium]|jgi:Uma2 family endonuclease